MLGFIAGFEIIHKTGSGIRMSDPQSRFTNWENEEKEALTKRERREKREERKEFYPEKANFLLYVFVDLLE